MTNNIRLPPVFAELLGGKCFGKENSNDHRD